jgi:glycosyltransferase involved in cell wall biosynthesis
MRIGFIAIPYEEHGASGMGYVVHELMRHMLVEGRGKHTFVFYSRVPISRSFIEGEYENVIIPKGFIRQFLWFLTHRLSVDALFFNVPLLPLWTRGKTKMIPIVQELEGKDVPLRGIRTKVVEFTHERILTPLTLWRAAHIVTPSDATKQEVIAAYGVPEQKIAVLPNGFQDLTKVLAVPPEPTLNPYFFFAGRVKFRKNVHGIVAAFIDFKKRTQAPVKLVIAGPHGGDYSRGLHEQLERAGLMHDVQFRKYAVAGELRGLYENALACVFPSLHEGFGMPIIEAMSLGVPVITSSVSATAEVGADAALLVPPKDILAISEAMEKIYADASLRDTLIQKGLARAKLFSWSRAAREYLALAAGRD